MKLKTPKILFKNDLTVIVTSKTIPPIIVIIYRKQRKKMKQKELNDKTK